MTVSVGSRLGSYEVTSAIGAGGMGEVYRARDTRLKRDVAIKVLPAAFAHDPDRLDRFQREAEMLATLNHPNIAAIYGLETTDALTGIVLELVEGDTLAAHRPRQRVHEVGVACRRPGAVAISAHRQRAYSGSQLVPEQARFLRRRLTCPCHGSSRTCPVVDSTSRRPEFSIGG